VGAAPWRRTAQSALGTQLLLEDPASGDFHRPQLETFACPTDMANRRRGVRGNANSGRHTLMPTLFLLSSLLGRVGEKLCKARS
jgi:hypothetical protein